MKPHNQHAAGLGSTNGRIDKMARGIAKGYAKSRLTYREWRNDSRRDEGRRRRRGGE